MDDIKHLLENSKNIAIVGLSAKVDRASNMVAKYLIQAGYSVFPVNPGQETILIRTCYPDLESLPEKIDIVNIFRKSEDVLPIAEAAVSIGCQAIWMQLGIENKEAEQLALDNNIQVIMNRCIKVDHSTLFPTL